jgi:transcriptional regulator with XRE-family HTH domain
MRFVCKQMQRSPDRHVLVRLRRELGGMTQSEFGRLVGLARRTIQDVELCALPLSERAAHEISEKTGVAVPWLLENDLEKSPLARDGKPWNREYFHLAQQEAWLAGRVFDEQPLIVLFRAYYELRDIVGKRNFPQLIKGRFLIDLQKAVLSLWESIPDPELRKRLFRNYRDKKTSDEELLRQVIRDARDCLAAIRNEKQLAIEEEKTFALLKRKKTSRSSAQKRQSPPPSR